VKNRQKPPGRTKCQTGVFVQFMQKKEGYKMPAKLSENREKNFQK